MVYAALEVLSSLPFFTEEWHSGQKFVAAFCSALWLFFGLGLWHQICTPSVHDVDHWFAFAWFFVACLAIPFRFFNSVDVLRLFTSILKVLIVLPIAIVWDIFSSLFLLLQYILFLIPRLVLQSALLVLGFSLSLLKSFVLLIQIPILMFFGLFLHSLLLSYFLGVRLFTHVNRFCNIMACSFLSLYSKAFIFRRPRYRQNILGSQCVDGCERRSLCETCKRVIDSSPLLIGTAWGFTLPVERHPHHTAKGIKESAEKCHLCNLLLRSVESSGDSVDSERPSQYGSILLSDSNISLTMKVWETRYVFERPLLRIQLIGGKFKSDPLIVEEFHHGTDLHECDKLEDKTGSSATLKWAKRQISDCLKHENCHNYLIPQENRNFRPTRLLDVGQNKPNDSKIVRLVLTSSLDPATYLPYVALSHCWGGNIASSLSEENCDSRKKSITITELPKNFQNAVFITRAIGFRYLWVDSLCIKQDSIDDREEEIKNMGLLYANAICTISATAAKDPTVGCFFSKKRFIGDCSLAKEGEMSLMVTFPGREATAPANLFRMEVEGAPLTKRAWAFQERVLTTRVLHFCKGIVLFECNTMQASNCHINGRPYPRNSRIRVDGKRSFSVGPSPPPPAPLPGLPRLPPLPTFPALLPRTSWSFPQFRLRGPSEGTHIWTTREAWGTTYTNRPVTRPARPTRVLRTESVPNPNYNPNLYNFDGFFDFHDIYSSFDFTNISGLYRFSELYDFLDSYTAFKEYASWRPQRAEVTDMSARLGMRGAFEMLIRFEGHTPEEQLEFHDSWYQIVEQYSHRRLTRDTDKIPAIEGIAYFIAEKRKFNFMAGLWREFLPLNLLWVLKKSPGPETTPKKRPTTRVVPSWSWASVDGRISHLLNEPSTKTVGTAWKLIPGIDIQPVSECTLELSCSLHKLDPTKGEFIPDIELEPSTNEELMFLPIISLNSKHFYGPSPCQLHGIVLRARDMVSDTNNKFERVGYFWTAESNTIKGILEGIGPPHRLQNVWRVSLV